MFCCSVPEVEAEVFDKLKYIEETKETMDKNTKKIAEIVQDMSGVQTGESTLQVVQRSFLLNHRHTGKTN